MLNENSDDNLLVPSVDCTQDDVLNSNTSIDNRRESTSPGGVQPSNVQPSKGPIFVSNKLFSCGDPSPSTNIQEDNTTTALHKSNNIQCDQCSFASPYKRSLEVTESASINN